MTTTKKPLRDRYSPTTRAMFDALVGQSSAPIGDILPFGIRALLATEYDKAIAAGKRARRSTTCSTAQYALSGARATARAYLFIAARQGHVIITGKSDTDTVEMTREFRRQWKRAKEESERRTIKDTITEQKFGDVAHYGGISEWEGWAHAPLHSYDVLHIRPYRLIDLDTWHAAFPGWDIKQSPDGQVSVLAPPGAPVKEVVLAWMDDNGIHHEGIREAKNQRRRDLNDLPPVFLADLIESMTPLARGLIKGRHGSSLNKLFDDTDDVHSHITVWLLELAQSFDAHLGNPFGTWVTKQLPRKLHDLNRTLHGRTASDAEIFFARAVSTYQSEHGHNPSLTELAEHLNITVEEVKHQKRHMDKITSLRNASALVRDDAGEENIDIPDEGLPPDERAELDERAHQVTMAILTATGAGPTETHGAVLRKPLGFMVTYLLNYDEWVKGDLIHLAGCRDRKVSDEVSSVNKSLARNLSDYRTGTEYAKSQ